MDSDSDWEPPGKKRKLNNGKTRKRRKTRRSKRSKQSQLNFEKEKPRKRKMPHKANKKVNNTMMEIDSDDSSGIEILWDDNDYFPSSTNNKNNASNKNKKKSFNKKIKNTKRKQPPSKQSRLKFKPISMAVQVISDLDTLICGYYRLSLSDNKDKSERFNNLNIAIPKDITNIIFEYQKNIMYIKVNFVWTHKHNCCYDYKNCKTLKQNRGNYVFERDPYNAFDENAIKILTKSGKQVGHIPRDIAECLSPLLDINKIDLVCVGGVKGNPCREVVEIIPITTLTDQEMESLREYLEEAPFDENRYIHSKEKKK